MAVTVDADNPATTILDELEQIAGQLRGADAAVRALRARRDGLIVVGHQRGIKGPELGRAAGFSSHRRVSQILEAVDAGEPREHRCRIADCGEGPFSARGRSIHESVVHGTDP